MGLRGDFVVVLDPHAIERSPNEDHGDGKEDDRQSNGQLTIKLDRHFNSQQTKQSCELDDRIHCH